MPVTKIKLEKVVPFVKNIPQMPDPVLLALTWINGHASQGWVNKDVKLEWSQQGNVEQVVIQPSFAVRGDRFIQLTHTETPAAQGKTAGYEFKLVKTMPFVRNIPQMPDPVMLATTWINGYGGEGWSNPDIRIEHTQAGPLETATLHPTIDVRGEKHILLRRQVEVAAK